jgi:hypothetical protein
MRVHLSEVLAVVTKQISMVQEGYVDVAQLDKLKLQKESVSCQIGKQQRKFRKMQEPWAKRFAIMAAR